MLRFGEAPFLECSTKGDRRFSAFCAFPKSLKGKSIEEAYQAMKIFEDGSTGLSWREAKGRRAINAEACATAYETWWREYTKEKSLLPVLLQATGLSDVFGQTGSVCQAEVLWRIRAEATSASVAQAQTLQTKTED
jgi:hypothetical protein